MLNKIKALLGSVRFWLLTVAMLGEVANIALTGEPSFDAIFMVIQVWIGAVVALGTFDSVSEKFGSMRDCK